MTAARVGGARGRQGRRGGARPSGVAPKRRSASPDVLGRPPCPRAEDASAWRLMGAGAARGRDNGHEDLEGSRGATQVARRLRRKPCHWNARRRTWPPTAARET